MQCLTAWAVRSVDEVSCFSQSAESQLTIQRPRAGETSSTLAQSGAPERTHESRRRRSAAPTPVPHGPTSPAMSQLPGYDFNPSFAASQSTFHTFPNGPVGMQHQHQHQHQGQFGPPGYMDMSGGRGVYPHPGFGGSMMNLHGGGHPGWENQGFPSWDGSQRAFSPVPNFENGAGGGWYSGGGYGWPMM
jgi:hypothetical protein